MSKVSFKSHVGKTVYVKDMHLVKFTDEVYTTEDEDEIKALINALNVTEIASQEPKSKPKKAKAPAKPKEEAKEQEKAEEPKK